MTAFPFDRPFAHRGLHDAAKGVIENSRSAFTAAINRGVAIECDLQMTADGAAVVFHDSELKRLTGQDGLVSETQEDALCAMPLLGGTSGDTPLRFSELLAGVDGSVPLMVEIKQQDLPRQTSDLTLRALADIEGYGGPIAFKSFDPLALNTLYKAGFRGPRGIVVCDFRTSNDFGHLSGVQRFLLSNAFHKAVSHYTFISCEHTALSRPTMALRRFFGLKMVAWTIRSKQEAEAARRHASQIVFEGFDPEA